MLIGCLKMSKCINKYISNAKNSCAAYFLFVETVIQFVKVYLINRKITASYYTKKLNSISTWKENQEN